MGLSPGEGAGSSQDMFIQCTHPATGVKAVYNVCRPAAEAEEGKKKSEEEVKAEQEALSKDQTAALKKGLAQITVSANALSLCCMRPFLHLAVMAHRGDLMPFTVHRLTCAIISPPRIHASSGACGLPNKFCCKTSPLCEGGVCGLLQEKKLSKAQPHFDATWKKYQEAIDVLPEERPRQEAQAHPGLPSCRYCLQGLVDLCPVAYSQALLTIQGICL